MYQPQEGAEGRKTPLKPRAKTRKRAHLWGMKRNTNEGGRDMKRFYFGYFGDKLYWLVGRTRSGIIRQLAAKGMKPPDFWDVEQDANTLPRSN